MPIGGYRGVVWYWCFEKCGWYGW